MKTKQEDKNWNLSEKMIENDFVNVELGDDVCLRKDVKEFIKRLKEEIKISENLHNDCSLKARVIIDKLAGSKLI